MALVKCKECGNQVSNKAGKCSFMMKLFFACLFVLLSGYSYFAEAEGFAEDENQRIIEFRKWAEQGNARAQYLLGLKYELGDGVTKDETQALNWYRKAAEQGHAAAKSALEMIELKNKELANQASAQNDTKISIDEANKQINIVWNGTTKEIRKQLLPEQRIWLKKREADCKAEPNPEDCMVNMTLVRTEELKQKISAISGEKDNINIPVETNQNETTGTEVKSNESTQSSKENFYFIIKLVFIYYLLKPLYSFLKRLNLKNKANKIIDKKINEHIKALSLKRKQKIERDAYGNIIYEKWFKEIDYFIKNVLCENVIVHNYINSSNDNVSDKIIDAVREYDRNNKTAHDDIDVSNLSPYDFEHYCADILKNNGWQTRVTQASGDQGIDIIATYGNIKAVFQCKKYSNPIGNKAVQEIVAGKQFEQADIAAVVSNKGYTASAKQLAQSTGTYLLHYSELAEFHQKIGM